MRSDPPVGSEPEAAAKRSLLVGVQFRELLVEVDYPGRAEEADHALEHAPQIATFEVGRSIDVPLSAAARLAPASDEPLGPEPAQDGGDGRVRDPDPPRFEIVADVASRCLPEISQRAENVRLQRPDHVRGVFM